MEQISNITKFNYNEFYTWRAAFREVVKLSSGVILDTLKDRFTAEQIEKIRVESEQRIQAWLTQGRNEQFGDWAILGAEQAIAFSKKYNNDHRALSYINDIEWLKNEFTRQYT